MQIHELNTFSGTVGDNDFFVTDNGTDTSKINASAIVAPSLAPIESEIAVLDARMDTFASLPDGSTAGDAELLDIRVGADGTTYPSAGDAVRGQISDLKSELSALTVATIDHSEQLINVADAVSGAIQNDGSISTAGTWANYKTSDYIPIEAGKTYTFYLIKSDGTQPAAVYRMRYALYDTSKSLLSYENTDDGNTMTIQAVNNGFLRVTTIDVSNSGYAFSRMAMLVDGVTKYGYEEYYSRKTTYFSNELHFNTTQDTEAKNSALNVLTDEVTHLGTITIIPEWTSGYRNKSGTTGSSNDYAYTQIFDVGVGDVVEIWDATNEEFCNLRFVTAYSNGSAVSTSGQEGGYSYTVPSGIDQICITALTVMDLDNATIHIHGTVTEKKVKESYLPSIGNILYGKKWAVCGDSFTAYTNKVMESGDYVGKMRTYPFLIGSRNMMQIDDRFASSGRTLAYPVEGTFTNSLTCPTDAGYYQNIPADADYITIMLGINDSQHTGSGSTGDGEDATGVITLGDIDDVTTATYYGAWNTVLGWLRENRPFAHIGIIVSNGIEEQEWVEAIEAVATKWGYPTLNLNGDDRCPAMIRSYNPNIPTSIKNMIKQKQAVDYDGTQTGSVNTHPNWQTHEYESTFIEAWLRTL